MINQCIEKMAAADGIIIGSPTHFADLTPETKALIDRAGFVAMANGYMFKRKVGAAVVAVRRAGAIHVFDSINHLFLISQMIIAGSSYWNIGMGLEERDVERDQEGLATMRTLGQNMGWLLKRLQLSESTGGNRIKKIVNLNFSFPSMPCPKSPPSPTPPPSIRKGI